MWKERCHMMEQDGQMAVNNGKGVLIQATSTLTSKEKGTDSSRSGVETGLSPAVSGKLNYSSRLQLTVTAVSLCGTLIVPLRRFWCCDAMACQLITGVEHATGNEAS